jgi:hypothetical protein
MREYLEHLEQGAQLGWLIDPQTGRLKSIAPTVK